ncbi:MinD/ParA family ATP-binding protein [Micromonospora craniellae]|uniref:Chromosome partitioning protein n=1 Tax=Micromonospora craniellae TaxID=2294034 RepID=A0A372G051_9ACTN|nr:chromosome partitioning protein [Micromonospora craniellae]QOC94662.1 chromosome partitioning protein [Micromonospora craniellae]RFS46451.1 chromosome partitioning protein [Micromonospora craniellae]
MVDENADRAHVPGQQGAPERDIEPLWPPDQVEGFGTPAWATPPTPPTTPPAPPGGSAQPVPPTAGQPDHLPPTGQPVGPPSPADYPSLTAGGPTGAGGESGATPGPGWAPGPPPVVGGRASVPPPTGWAPVPTPQAPTPQPEHGRVDLDLPFTLDRPTSLAPPRDGTPGDAGPQPDATPGPGPGPSTDTGPAADDDGGPQLDGDPEAAMPETSTNGGDHRKDDGTPPTWPSTKSPWAQPPQRSTAGPTDPSEHADRPPRPSWATGMQPLPPVPSGPGRPVPPQAGTYPVPAPQHGTPVPPPQVGPVPEYQGTAAVPPSPQHGVPMPPPQPGPVPHQPGPVPHQAETPPGPFPPQPAWNAARWQQGAPPPVAPPAPQSPYPAANPAPASYPEPTWNQEVGVPPTAEDFARRRQVRPVDPVATMGVRAVVNKTGLVKLPPGRQELELKRDIETVRRNFGGLRQVTVVNPKGGAGKTVAILLLAMTFGQKRGGYVLAWDNNETQGTLGMRAQQDFHSRTVRDLLRDLGQFHGAHGRVGDLSQYVRSQGEGMFDVLASDESATGGEMLTASAFGEIREVVSRFYKLIFVDTGNNVRAQNWQAAMDATDQLVVTMSARNDSAETAARMLDHLEQSGRQRLVRQAVTVVSMPPSRKEIDLPAIQEHFAARTRAVLLAPYERLIDTGEPLRYAQLSAATREAWLKIAASVAEGL